MSRLELVRIDHGRLVVASEYLASLRAMHLNNFENIMSHASSGVVRSVPGRSTVCIRMPAPEGGPCSAYLKRYDPQYLSTFRLILRATHWPGAADEAMREWNNILRLRQHGILTPAPIALGQRRQLGVVTHSFLLVREVEGGIPADNYFNDYLQHGPPKRKWQLMTQIAQIAHTMQDAGFVHKDLYMKRFLVVEQGEGWDVYLIDFQRAVGPGRHRDKWHVNDLGSLAYSGRTQAHFSRASLMRMYKAYARISKLEQVDKELIKVLWRRVQRLQQRQSKYLLVNN